MGLRSVVRQSFRISGTIYTCTVHVRLRRLKRDSGRGELSRPPSEATFASSHYRQICTPTSSLSSLSRATKNRSRPAAGPQWINSTFTLADHLALHTGQADPLDPGQADRPAPHRLGRSPRLRSGRSPRPSIPAATERDHTTWQASALRRLVDWPDSTPVHFTWQAVLSAPCLQLLG